MHVAVLRGLCTLGLGLRRPRCGNGNSIAHPNPTTGVDDLEPLIFRRHVLGKVCSKTISIPLQPELLDTFQEQQETDTLVFDTTIVLANAVLHLPPFPFMKNDSDFLEAGQVFDQLEKRHLSIPTVTIGVAETDVADLVAAVHWHIGNEGSDLLQSVEMEASVAVEDGQRVRVVKLAIGVSESDLRAHLLCQRKGSVQLTIMTVPAPPLSFVRQPMRDDLEPIALIAACARHEAQPVVVAGNKSVLADLVAHLRGEVLEAEDVRQLRLRDVTATIPVIDISPSSTGRDNQCLLVGGDWAREGE